MNRSQYSKFISILMGLSIGICSYATASKTETVAITVGGKPITQAKIDTVTDLMAKAQTQEGRGEIRPEQYAQMQKLVATNLIGQQLLELEAKSTHTEATPAEIDSVLKEFKHRFPDDATFKKALAAAGDNETKLKTKLAKQIRADKVLAARVKRPQQPTEKEMADFWEKHKKDFPVSDSLRALQIILRADDKTPADEAGQKREKLEMVRQQLDKDSAPTPVLLQRFMSAAAQISEGPEAQTGGDLQRFDPNDFNAEFRKQVKALKVGQLSPVFKSPLGYHLILLIEKYDGKYDSYKLQILQNLVNERTAVAGEEMRQVLKGLAAKYPVKYLNPKDKDSSESGLY